MPKLDANASVGSFVRESPSRARVFESFEIDYCCGGKVSLASACEKRGVAIDTVLEELSVADDDETVSDLVNVDAISLTELADHIEQAHHAYLRQELPRLDVMTEKVARVHGDKEPRLARVRDAFVALRAELEPHMMKEEQILFPLIRQMESTGAPHGHPCGSVANPIRQMEHEHDQAGDALAVLRESTDGFTPPEWACNTYRAMLDSLAQLEHDMHQHIHKENNVLFPKAAALESQASGSGAVS